MSLIRRDLGKGAYIDYDPEWIPSDEADDLLARLTEELEWDQRAIRVAGKEIMQPRLTAWSGELPYRYSGQTLEPRPPTPALHALLERVRAVTDVPFNHALLNRYRDGRDSMGMHADDEPELGKEPTIAAISLGARRRFVLKPKKGHHRITYQLEHGSLLVMGGTMQHRWYHGVPKQTSVETERINVTFRYLLEPPRPRRTRPPANDGEVRAPTGTSE